MLVSWNPADGEVYSIQYYVIECVSDLQQVSPHRNLQPDHCGPVLPLATYSLDFTPCFTHTSVEGKLINLCMSYRLEMKFFFILKLVANRGFRFLNVFNRSISTG
jgi:hypothetical protein